MNGTEATRPITLDVLGSMEARVLGRRVPLGGPKQRALLAALLLKRGRVAPVDHLVDVLWEDAPPVTAVVKVQGHVHALRKSLAGCGCQDVHEVLATRAPGYALLLGRIRTDLAAFDELTSAAELATAAGRRADASILLGSALGLWRGGAFADVPAPAVRAAAQRLGERRMTAVEDRAQCDLELGRFRQVLDELGEFIEENPFRERLRELQMLALIGLDRTSEAIVCYQHGRRLLGRELGVEPCHRLRRLAASIGYRQ